MKEHEIVSAVAGTAGITDYVDAQRATMATLDVLGARLAGGTPGKVAAQLPGRLAEMLPRTGPGERFDVAEFYRRVAEREGVEPASARRHAKAVLAALKVSLTGDEYRHLCAQLPADYADLTGTEPVQHH